jgi:hypothetical protein
MPVEKLSLVNYEDLSPVHRCFVLGAGASYDARVPVQNKILTASQWCLDYLKKKGSLSPYEERTRVDLELIVDQAKTRFSGTDTQLEVLYDGLDGDQRNALDRVIIFILSRVGFDHLGFFYRRDTLGRRTNSSYDRFAKTITSSDIIVTFNYDTYLDSGLAGSWKLHYGARILPWPEDRAPAKGKDEDKTIRLLRLHGSAGWLVCDHCHYVEDFGDLNIYELGSERAIVGAKDVDAYCPKCLRESGVSSMGLESMTSHGSVSLFSAFGRRHCAILPALDRQYDVVPLNHIWPLCEQAIRNCTEIIVVGYSMPTADKAFVELVKQALATRSNSPSVTVVDPSGPTGPAWKNISACFGKPNTKAKFITFSAWLDEQGTP